MTGKMISLQRAIAGPGKGAMTCCARDSHRKAPPTPAALPEYNNGALAINSPVEPPEFQFLNSRTIHRIQTLRELALPMFDVSFPSFVETRDDHDL